MSEGEGSKTLRKEGETVSGSIFLDPVTRGYGLRLRTSREEDEMTISNTLTVRSGQLLTTSTIRWSRLYMTAHSYAVTFHCILINTWLNQKRMSLLITQDKRTRHSPASDRFLPLLVTVKTKSEHFHFLLSAFTGNHVTLCVCVCVCVTSWFVSQFKHVSQCDSKTSESCVHTHLLTFLPSAHPSENGVWHFSVLMLRLPVEPVQVQFIHMKMNWFTFTVLFLLGWYLVNSWWSRIIDPDLHFNTESWLWASPVTDPGSRPAVCSADVWPPGGSRTTWQWV